LRSIEFLGDSKVLKVLVISPYLDGVASTFEVVSPLFKSFTDGEHLGVVDVIILLYRVQHFQQKDDGVPSVIFARLLGENCSSSDARAVSLELKWEIIIREYQNGSRSDQFLELHEGIFLG
jgi:hypothetical protein